MHSLVKSLRLQLSVRVRTARSNELVPLLLEFHLPAQQVRALRLRPHRQQVAGPVAANEAEILLLPHLRQAPLPTISRFGNVVERRSAHVSLQDSEPAALITMQAHGHLDRNRT